MNVLSYLEESRIKMKFGENFFAAMVNLKVPKSFLTQVKLR